MSAPKPNVCCICKRNLNVTEGGGDDFVVFRPCFCKACPRCAFQLCCNRRYSTPTCPFDEEEIHHAWFFEGSRISRKKFFPIEIERYKADIEKEPGRVFTREFQKNKEGMKDKMFLNLTYSHRLDSGVVDGSGYAPSTVTAILDSRFGFESEKDEANLRKIFAFLHDPIMKHHYEKELKERKTLPRMTPAEFCEFCVEQDESLLLKLVFALTTGKIQFVPSELSDVDSKQSREKNKRLSEFLAVCVAKCMIERANTNAPGPLQLMIGDLLSMVNAPNHTKDFMSKIRLSSGRRTADRHMLKRAFKNMLTHVKLEPLDSFCLSLDNFGFKGKKGKWSQHTVIQIAKIRAEKLRKLGFYNEYQINRVGKTMHELLENSDEDTVATSIVIPSRQDYRILSKRILTTIQTAAILDLPTVQKCRELLHLDEGACWQYKVPANLGVRIKTRKNLPRENEHCDTFIHNAALENLELSGEGRGDETATLPSTFYEMNDITIDEVLHGDPGSYAVIKKIVEYMEDASIVEDFDPDSSGGETPVRGIIAAATADGGPSKRWLDYQASDIDEEGSFENRKHKLSRFFVAGFHFMMEFLTMRGRLSRSYTSFFARKWRPKEPQLDWIYVIRDPNEALSEWREYLLAHYRTAAEQSGKTDPVQVHEYMLQRAIEVPTCMAVLLDLRLLEILFMIRDSEKAGTHGDVPLFLTCMRFSLPLFAVTHATSYCHLVCDFLEWFHLASDAERILFENFFYTKLSNNGKPIWADRGVEWTVRHIRMFMGHRIRPQKHDESVSRTVGEIPFRIRAKRDLRYLLNCENHKGYTTMDWNDQEFCVGKAFLSTRIALDETNFWGKGALCGELECNSTDSILLKKGSGDDEERRMSASLLSAYDLGITRIQSYFIEHHIQNRYPKTRSETNISLKVLPTTHERRENDIEKTRLCRLSVEKSELEPLTREFPRAAIVDELDYYRDFCFPDIPPYKSSDKRTTLVTALCQHRKRYFQRHPEIYRNTKAAIEELDRSEAATTQESRTDQIRSTIYSLDEDVLDEFRNNGNATVNV